MKIGDWIKNNKLTTVLIAVVFFLLWQKNSTNLSSISNRVSKYPATSDMVTEGSFGVSPGSVSKSISPIRNQAAPQPDVADRLVVQESNVSLVVDQVREKTDQVLSYVSGKGGYMISSSISQPEEVPYATIEVRVPAAELRPTIEYLRSLAIKVSSEYLNGYDVTDQYVDIQARMETLTKTKAKFEEILAKAEKVADILQVQQEIISLQNQIDSLKGQQQYLEKTAENARLTAYLSTDEFSLPYAPQDKSFRPKVIFKLAVRSLVSTFRWLGNNAIWIGVYSVIWLPLLLIYGWWKRRKTNP